MNEKIPGEDSGDFGIDALKDLFLLDKTNIAMMMYMVSKQPEAEREIKMNHIKIALEELGLPVPSDEAVEAFSRQSQN